MPKTLQYAQNSQCVQNLTFPNRKHIFPNSLINAYIRGTNGISHLLYVKFEMWTALFCINYLSIFNSET